MPTTETATHLIHTYDPACSHGGEGVTVHHAPGSESWFVCPVCTPLGPFRSYGTGSLYEPDGEPLQSDPFLPNFPHREDFASESEARAFIARVLRCETLEEVYAAK